MCVTNDNTHYLWRNLFNKKKFDYYGIYRDNSGFWSVIQRCIVIVEVSLSLMSVAFSKMVALVSVYIIPV